MENKQNILLIGNGLNRTLDNGVEWGNLLQELANIYNVSICPNTPLPLEFECIINDILKNNPKLSSSIYESAKKIITDKIKLLTLPPQAIHYKIAELPINKIMTTNYDYFIEYVFDSHYSQGAIGVQSKYIFDSTSCINGIAFYHLHGIIDNPKSICLGYEHYSGIVQKLRNELNTKENNKTDKMRIKQILFGDRDAQNTWGELFYMHNIHIVGFGFNSFENDLWWLITHRAYLHYSDYCGLKKIINNEIIYYDIIDDVKRENKNDELMRYEKELEQKEKHSLLKREFVIIKEYYLSEYGNFENAYIKIFNDIKSSINNS